MPLSARNFKSTTWITLNQVVTSTVLIVICILTFHWQLAVVAVILVTGVLLLSELRIQWFGLFLASTTLCIGLVWMIISFGNISKVPTLIALVCAVSLYGDVPAKRMLRHQYPSK